MVEIIRAAEADVAAFLALDPVGFAAPARRALLLDRIAEGNAFAAMQDSVLAGYALRGRFFSYDFLELLYVDAARRRTGLGETLVVAFDAARRTDRLFISTNESNAPMRALLAKLGYAASGMILNLDPGDPELVFVKRFDGLPVET